MGELAPPRRPLRPTGVVLRPALAVATRPDREPEPPSALVVPTGHRPPPRHPRPSPTRRKHHQPPAPPQPPPPKPSSHWVLWRLGLLVSNQGVVGLSGSRTLCCPHRAVTTGTGRPYLPGRIVPRTPRHPPGGGLPGGGRIPAGAFPAGVTAASFGLMVGTLVRLTATAVVDPLTAWSTRLPRSSRSRRERADGGRACGAASTPPGCSQPAQPPACSTRSPPETTIAEPPPAGR